MLERSRLGLCLLIGLHILVVCNSEPRPGALSLDLNEPEQTPSSAKEKELDSSLADMVPAPRTTVQLSVDSRNALHGRCFSPHGTLDFESDLDRGVVLRSANGRMQIFSDGISGINHSPPASLMHACSHELGRTHNGGENVMARQLHYLALLINKHAAAEGLAQPQVESDLQFIKGILSNMNQSAIWNTPAKFQGKDRTCPGKVSDASDWMTWQWRADGKRVNKSGKRIGMCGVHKGAVSGDNAEWTQICGGRGCRIGCAYHDACDCTKGYLSKRCLGVVVDMKKYTDFCGCCNKNCQADCRVLKNVLRKEEEAEEEELQSRKLLFFDKLKKAAAHHATKLASKVISFGKKRILDKIHVGVTGPGYNKGQIVCKAAKPKASSAPVSKSTLTRVSKGTNAPVSKGMAAPVSNKVSEAIKHSNEAQKAALKAQAAADMAKAAAAEAVATAKKLGD